LCAAVWVLGLDVAGNGQGFGAAPDDFAGLEIEELDPAGRLLVRHPPVGIRKATADFQRISLQFSTRPETARIRFTLRSKIGCVWQHGAAIFDDAALVQIESARKTSDKDVDGSSSNVTFPGQRTCRVPRSLARQGRRDRCCPRPRRGAAKRRGPPSAGPLAGMLPTNSLH